MFTGIVEQMGIVERADRSDAGMRFAVSAAGLSLSVGDSIAVNGVCLTAVSVEDSGFEADVVLEAFARMRVALIPSIVIGTLITMFS